MEGKSEAALSEEESSVLSSEEFPFIEKVRKELWRRGERGGQWRRRRWRSR